MGETQEKSNCPLCDLRLESIEIDGRIPDVYIISCFRCGHYCISDVACIRLPKEMAKRIRISSWLINNQNTTILSDDINKLSNLPISNPPEKADMLLLAMAKRHPTAGVSFDNLPNIFATILSQVNNPKFGELDKQYKKDLRLIAEAEILGRSELGYIWDTFLTETKNYLIRINKDKYHISPTGWDHIYSIQSANSDSQSAFVAMRFLPHLTKFNDKYIIPAIINAGYKPIRLDLEQHFDLIDDRIVAGIRKSKFIVADLTENSYGVYFEAGFARGLGLPVIYICEKEFFENKKKEENKGVHFDVNHYSFMMWENDKGFELMEKLQTKIEAIIGRGSYTPELEKKH